VSFSGAQPGHGAPGGKAVANGHERSIAPQVNGHMAPSAIVDVEEVAPCTNCRVASGGLSADQSQPGAGRTLAPLD
jgi:hypothetical protein